MKQRIQRKSVVGGIVATFLAVVVSLALIFTGEANGDVIGEPLDTATKARLRGTNLDFIAETGRIVVTEKGTRKIIWDPPQLPTLEEAISMAEAAKESGDASLLPLCTEGFLQYNRSQKEKSGELTKAPITDSKPPAFPICRAIPDQIGIAPNRYYRPPQITR